MSPEAGLDFEHWHAHEHFPERLGIPGFRRASRWISADGGEGVFVMYELEDHGVLGSAAYLARLNAPTPWSQRLMPHHRNMVRSQCRVLESRGGLTARQALTIRMSPSEGRPDGLRAALCNLGGELVGRPGLAGLHLVRQGPPAIAPTEEQRIRGLSDQVADWVLVACGYDAAQLQDVSRSALDDAALVAMGAQSGIWRGTYALAYSATPVDMG